MYFKWPEIKLIWYHIMILCDGIITITFDSNQISSWYLRLIRQNYLTSSYSASILTTSVNLSFRALKKHQDLQKSFTTVFQCGPLKPQSLTSDSVPNDAEKEFTITETIYNSSITKHISKFLITLLTFLFSSSCFS